ncbi:MAG TPA: hypothetical protein VE422_34125 [Terriglobia bacterium]|nr:hypothetical protein [Terriglobia bacterium]
MTRIFSVTLMYHYAFLVLSITLFGLGSGGIFHFVSDSLRKRPESAAWLALAAGASLPFCLGLILRLPFSPQVFSLPNVAVLLLIVILAGIPFFFAGLFISLLYILNRDSISRLYAFDLIGAAFGCLVAVSLIGVLGAPLTPVVAGFLLALSALLVPAGQKLEFRVGFVVVLVMLGFLSGTGWLQLKFVKGGIEDNLEFEKWNAFSRVAVSRFGEHRLIHIDADAATEVLSNTARQSGLENFAGITRLAYLIRKNSKALVIGPGGGREVGAALAAGSTVTGVEINPIIVNDLMRGKYAAFSGNLYSSPGVQIVTADARSFLERTTDQYDVIQQNAVDTWAAASGGGFTLSESYLYTVEAFETYFRRLKDDGILTVGRWVFQQPQQMIRVIAVALEAMERQYPGDYRRRFFLVSDSSYEQGGGIPGVVIIKKEPLTDSELETLRQAASAGHYNVLYDPALTVSNPYVDLINSKDRSAFFDKYPLNIRPPSDNKPFFFFTLKWRDVLSVWNTPAESRKNNAGLFLLAAACAIMLVLTLATFVLPMLTRSGAGIGASAGCYFLCIGLAFMMVETVMVQRATLFLGHPTYSFPTVLCALLVGAGAGSWLTRKVEVSRLSSQLSHSFIGLIIVMTVLQLVLPVWLTAGFQFPLWIRIGWLSLPLFILGLMLGRVFPLGLRRLTESEVPWAWALNGSASVLGSILAVLLAMQAGFSMVLWIAIGLYALAGASVRIKNAG